MTRKLEFFESENRMSFMFSTLAGSVFGTNKGQTGNLREPTEWAELREDLDRIEQEAGLALKELYDNYLSLAKDLDTFEIGLQPDNIRVMRVAILWVPVVHPGSSPDCP
jgi:hypothetical protein